MQPTPDDSASPGSSCTPLQLSEYASLVAALFRGPFQENPWDDFLKQLRDICSSSLAVIGRRLPTPGDAGMSWVGGADFSPQDLANFANNYSALAHLVDLPDGETVSLDDLISRKKLRQTPYYQAFMKPFDQEQVMGFDIQQDGKVVLFVRLIRGHGQADFGTRERAVLELLKPQCRVLVTWLESSRSLTREHHLYAQAFSSLALGTVILDAELRIVYRNNIAEQLLHNSSGITSAGGKLRVLHHQQHQQFQQILAHLLTDNQRGVPQIIPVNKHRGPSPLFLTMRRLPPQDRMDDTRHIAVYMIDPELRQIDQAQLVMDAFGLTPQESRLVIALANGGTLEEFANETGVSKNTARTHLYASFRKVGVSQQSSLVSHVIRAIYGL